MLNHTIIISVERRKYFYSHRNNSNLLIIGILVP